MMEGGFSLGEFGSASSMDLSAAGDKPVARDKNFLKTLTNIQRYKQGIDKRVRRTTLTQKEPEARRDSIWSNFSESAFIWMPNMAPDGATRKFVPDVHSVKSVKKSLLQVWLIRQFCPPKGNTAIFITLVIAALAAFIVAYTVLGPIAGPGGPIWSVMVLILLGLITGQFIKTFIYIVHKYTGFLIGCPPFPGMLLMGLILNNVPYNLRLGEEDCLAAINSTHPHLNITADPTILSSIYPNYPDQQFNITDLSSNYTTIKSTTGPTTILPAVNITISKITAHLPPNITKVCKAQYVGHDMDPRITKLLRGFCLTCLLLMGGLEIDPTSLKKHALTITTATFFPCGIEGTVGALLSHFLLGFPWHVAFILGSVLTGVTPAIIVPTSLGLITSGHGVRAGIPTLAMSVTVVDAFFSIVLFNIMNGFYFYDDNRGAILRALHLPISMLIGVGFGTFWGTIASYIPNRDHPHVVFFRWFILMSGGLISIFGGQLFDFMGAGILSTFLGAFIAGKQWRREGWAIKNPVTKALQKMWIIIGPIVFGLMGAAIDFRQMAGHPVCTCIIVVVVSIIVRMIVTVFATLPGKLTFRERLFMACIWVPKTNVQALLGPIFLRHAKLTGASPEVVEWGEQILTMSMLAIICAPLGAILIKSMLPILLKDSIQKPEAVKEKNDDVENQDDIVDLDADEEDDDDEEDGEEQINVDRSSENSSEHNSGSDTD